MAYKTYSEKPRNYGSISALMQVQEAEQRNGVTYLKGVNLDTKENIAFCLEPATGDNAERYAKRPPLEKMLQGYKTGAATIKLDLGNIIQAENLRLNAGTGTASWVRVVAKNMDELPQKTVRGLLHLRVGHTKEGKAYGYALQVSQQAASYINADTPEGLEDGLKKIFSTQAKGSPAVVLRGYRDVNGSKQVEGSALLMGNWNSEEKREKTPEEMAAGVMTVANQMLGDYPGLKFSAIPAIRYPISSFALDDAKKAERLEKLSRTFYQDDHGRPLVRPAVGLGSTSEGRMFLGTAFPLNTGVSAMDPVFMNEFVPAPEMEAQNDASQNQQHQPTPEPGPDPDFAAMDDLGPDMPF